MRFFRKGNPADSGVLELRSVRAARGRSRRSQANGLCRLRFESKRLERMLWRPAVGSPVFLWWMPLARAQLVPVGSEFRVNSSVTADDLTRPSTAMSQSGDIIAVWEGQENGTPSILGRFFRLDGSAAGLEFQVNSYSFQSYF